MKRAAPVLLAILLGALATAIGMGVFLKLANEDRARLAGQINQAQQEAAQALKDKERIANEANQKVEAANDEVAKAQRVLQALEEEQLLLTRAVQLLKPPARDIRTWQQVVSFPLGVSLLLPPRTRTETNDNFSLTAIKDGVSTSTGADARWLSVTRYDAAREQELTAALSTSTVRSYLVNGRLLTGSVGALNGNGSLAVFRVRQTATSTHLLWIKDPGTLGIGNGIERLLGTLEFED